VYSAAGSAGLRFEIPARYSNCPPAGTRALESIRLVPAHPRLKRCTPLAAPGPVRGSRGGAAAAVDKDASVPLNRSAHSATNVDFPACVTPGNSTARPSHATTPACTGRSVVSRWIAASSSALMSAGAKPIARQAEAIGTSSTDN
jgi:hypothetical protein